MVQAQALTELLGQIASPNGRTGGWCGRGGDSGGGRTGQTAERTGSPKRVVLSERSMSDGKKDAAHNAGQRHSSGTSFAGGFGDTILRTVWGVRSASGTGDFGFSGHDHNGFPPGRKLASSQGCDSPSVGGSGPGMFRQWQIRASKSVGALSRAKAFTPLADQKWVTVALAYLKELDTITANRMELGGVSKQNPFATGSSEDPPKPKPQPKKTEKGRGRGSHASKTETEEAG